MAAFLSDEPVLMGQISGLFGVKGWVKVFSFTRPRETILEYDPWLIRLNGEWQSVHPLDSNAGGKSITVRLDGIDNRDQAQPLVGSDIAILPTQLPPPKDGEYYWAQLIGLNVINQQGVQLGVVDHLIETGANDVLVVVDKQVSQERLLPYIPDVVKQVDLTTGILSVDWDPDF